MSIEQTTPIFTDTDRADLERYLPAQGWEEVTVPTPLLKQWIHRQARASVQVPQAADLIDFDWLMDQAMEQVALVEGRTAAQVVEAVRDAMLRDIVRVRLNGGAELPLKQGAEAIGALYKLLLAAAQAEHHPRAFYASRPPDAVKAYMDTLTLKQTEVGSFVLRLASPLGELSEEPPSLQCELPNLPPLPPRSPPLGRRVIAQLARSVAAAAQAAEVAARKQHLDALEQTVTRGVSANLLDVLATFGESCEEGFAVEIDWAIALEAPELPRRVAFERAWTPLLRKAAAAFRSRPEGPRVVRLKGGVSKLLRPPSEEEGPRGGPIQLWTTLGARPLKVEAELSSVEYKVAVAAHGEDTPIWIRGTLEQQGKRWVLRGAHGVKFWSEQDDEDGESGEDDF